MEDQRLMRARDSFNRFDRKRDPAGQVGTMAVAPDIAGRPVDPLHDHPGVSRVIDAAIKNARDPRMLERREQLTFSG